MAFAAIDNDLIKYVSSGELSLSYILQPVLTVIISVATALILAFWLGRKVLTKPSRFRERVVLTTDLKPQEGYVPGFEKPSGEVIGREGIVTTVLRPSGKVVVDGKYYDAVAEDGQYIQPGKKVIITRIESGTLYCQKTDR